MSFRNKKQMQRFFQTTEILKSQGVKISRRSINDGSKRFASENRSVLHQAHVEAAVLSMKRFYHRRGWKFPPGQLHVKKTVDMINEYYGKEVCKYVPKDKMEKLRLP